MLKSSGVSEEISGILGDLLSFYPFHPNTLTIASILLALSGFAAMLTGYGWESVGMFAFAFFLDAADGAVARKKGLATKEGAFLDGIADRVVEFFLILGLLLGEYTFSIRLVVSLVATLFFGTCMTAFVKAYSSHSGILSCEKAKAMPGLLERGERVALLMLAPILYYGDMWPYDQWPVYLAALLSLFTFLNRTRYVISSQVPPAQA